MRGSDINISVHHISLDLGVAERGETTKTGTNQGVIPMHESVRTFYRDRKKTIMMQKKNGCAP